MKCDDIHYARYILGETHVNAWMRNILLSLDVYAIGNCRRTWVNCLYVERVVLYEYKYSVVRLA